LEISLQAALHRSSVSRSDFAYSGVGLSSMLATSFIPPSMDILDRFKSSAEADTFLPRQRGKTM
jgi:hypothetical protein